jgi:hypothetical protein
MIHTRIQQKNHNLDRHQNWQCMKLEAAHRVPWPWVATAPAELITRENDYGAWTDTTLSGDSKARSHPKKNHRAENSRPLTGGSWHAGEKAARPADTGAEKHRKNRRSLAERSERIDRCGISRMTHSRSQEVTNDKRLNGPRKGAAPWRQTSRLSPSVTVKTNLERNKTVARKLSAGNGDQCSES